MTAIRTFREVSQIIGISSERVRQIEAVAFRKIKRAIEQSADPELNDIVMDLFLNTIELYPEKDDISVISHDLPIIII